MTTWFETLTGVREVSPNHVRENLFVEGEQLKSRVTANPLICGRLEMPSLADLRERARSSEYRQGKISVREVVANVQNLHADETNRGSLFQVASQFNLLEMVGPGVTPEQGVGIYENDHTQGPACAIAAGAGTIYRNYFAIVNGQIGQTAENQLDCLADLGAALENSNNRLWVMTNGYAQASASGLQEISKRLGGSSEHQLDELRKLLRIGIQWNTQVTLLDSTHLLSQAYCSALPVAYSRHPSQLWEPFARLVLESSYEATICAGIINSCSTGNRTLFLTRLGGGAFGNASEWITGAIERALKLYAHVDLDVALVSYGSSTQHAQQIVERFSQA